MPLDAFCLAAVKDELSGQIRGMKIDKVQQPERDVFILSLRSKEGKTQRLLISAGTGDARIHLTEYKFENPKSPPMFCMLLRKHISGAKILDVIQPPAERILLLKLETSNAIGIRSEMHLILEMIGRLANIVLVDSDGIITDCLRRFGGELNEKRQVLPGLLYRNPPPQEGKIDPQSITNEDMCELIRKVSDATVDRWLISTFTSFSPLICREISWRAYGETDCRIDTIKDNGAALRREFFSIVEKVKSNDFEPWMISIDAGTPYDFSYTCIKQYEEAFVTKCEESFSSLLDSFYTLSAQKKRINQRSAATLKLMKITRDRLVRKLAIQRAELEETSKRDYLRECGDIITSSLHLLKKGQQSFFCEDFYSEREDLREIKLDPLKTPQQNAAKYYKAYKKAKNAGIYLTEQIQNGEIELVYVESVIDQIKRAESEQDLSEIRNELISTGYIKKEKSRESKQIVSSPLRYISTSGMRILAGRNNIQNEKLTLKSASKSDIWLHARKIHGAHVVISCEGKYPDEKTLSEAASIAACNSAAYADIKVPVDYTFVKNVRKSPGGRPGMVIYTDYQTILSVPDEGLVKQLRDDS